MYLDPKDTGNSLIETVKIDTSIKLKTLDKVFYKNNYYSFKPRLNLTNNVIFVEPYNGLHIYKNDSVTNGYFLKLIGVWGLNKITPTLIIAYTAIGDAIIDLSNYNEPKIESFQFVNYGYPPPISFELKNLFMYRYYYNKFERKKLFFECPSQMHGIVYGWKRGQINTQVCYTSLD